MAPNDIGIGSRGDPATEIGEAGIMRIDEGKASIRDMRPGQTSTAREGGPSLDLRDTFVRGGGADGTPGLSPSQLQELRAGAGSTLDTQWGFGANENAFNADILAALREKWGSYQPALPPIILKATVARESAFDPKAVSPTGYVGLLQIGKNEALSQGLKLEPVDERYIPEKNLAAGTGTLRIKHKVVTQPLSQYPNEPWARNVADYFSKNGAPTELQGWFMGLAAYNGGGGAVLRAMDYAIAEKRDPRAWKSLVEPRDQPKKSPLYHALVDVFGDKFAVGKYHEMGRYPVKILLQAGMITPAEAGEIMPMAPDEMPGDDTPMAQVDRGELIQQVRDRALSSDKELSDPLPALNRPGTNAVVDEMRDSTVVPGGEGRTFSHRRTNGNLFTPQGNWADIGTAVASDQLAGLSEAHREEFMRVTAAKPEDITPGMSDLMLLSPTKDFDHMVAPAPKVRFKKVDYSKIGDVTIQPKYLVMHYTANVKDTPDSVWNYFNTSRGKPSTQFIVGKDGEVLQAMAETQKCSGTLDFNNESISIEVCGNFRQEKETDAEFNSTVALVRYLQKKYQIPDTNIISHRQVDNNFGHVGRKPDPGFRFMNRLYDAIR